VDVTCYASNKFTVTFQHVLTTKEKKQQSKSQAFHANKTNSVLHNLLPYLTEKKKTTTFLSDERSKFETI
jgi:hypothetical protein